MLGRLIRVVISLFLVATMTLIFTGCHTTNTKESATKGSPETNVLEGIVQVGSGVVPYVTGMLADMALAKASEYGLHASLEDFTSLKRKIESPSDWVVISQSEPGIRFERGHGITFFVMNLDDDWKFENLSAVAQQEYVTRGIVMPNLKGMPLPEAEALVKKIGFREQTYDANEEEDRSIYIDSNWEVVEQGERAGSIVRRKAPYF